MRATDGAVDYPPVARAFVDPACEAVKANSFARLRVRESRLNALRDSGFVTPIGPPSSQSRGCDLAASPVSATGGNEWPRGIDRTYSSISSATSFATSDL